MYSLFNYSLCDYLVFQRSFPLLSYLPPPSTSTLLKTSRHGSTGPWRCSSVLDTAHQPIYGARPAWWETLVLYRLQRCQCESQCIHQRCHFLSGQWLCRLHRLLSSPQGTTCLNHILGKIIPGMKVLLGFPLPVHYMVLYLAATEE